MRLQSTLTLVFLFLFAHVCFADGLPPFSGDAVPAPPNYADCDSWLAKPAGKLKHDVDVFWVYPTVLHDAEHWIMPTKLASMKKAAGNTLRTQAAVFSDQANLFAPMYRQMNMAALSLSPDEQAARIKYGMQDVWHAFDYYMTHLNNGRPFILAGHSQGSNLLTEHVIQKWGSLGYESQLVAAYLIGWTITEENLASNPAVQMCEDAGQTNCFISYNTMEAGRQKAAPTLLPNAVATNPLSWKTDGVFVDASKNKGARFFSADGTDQLIPAFTSAQIVDGGLIVVPSDPTQVVSTANFPSGVYHMFDYSLFWENLVENVRLRISRYAQ